MLNELKELQSGLAGNTMKRWDYLKVACDYLKLNIKSIAEVGVYDGTMSVELRRLFPKAELYLIDPWIAYKAYQSESAGNRFVKDGIRSQAGYDAIYESVKAKFAGDRKTHIVRMESNKTGSVVPDVDLTFIDANHSYDYVMDDIDIWQPKTKYLLCGHDFYSWSGVRWAVSDSLNFVASGLNKGDVWISPITGPRLGHNLIYMVAFGPEYLRLAYNTYMSLLFYGYMGHIAIITNTDRPTWMRPCDICINVLDQPVLSYLKNTSGMRMFRNTTDDNSIDYLKARTCIDMILDLSKYRYILYLDCDTLAGGNVVPLLYLDDERILSLGQRHKTMAQGCGKHLFDKLSVIKMSAATAEHKSNSGIVGVPGKLAPAFFRKWRDIYIEFVGKGIKVVDGKDLLDENCLNYLFASTPFKRVFDDRVGYKSFRPGKILYHFIGGYDVALPHQLEMTTRIIKSRMEAGDAREEGSTSQETNEV